jgi:hypothetical protein
MSSVFVIVVHVVREESLQMTLVQSDDVVEQFASATADPSLGNAVLPRTLKRGLDASDLHEMNGRRHF